jgi:hypothetical protein
MSSTSFTGSNSNDTTKTKTRTKAKAKAKGEMPIDPILLTPPMIEPSNRKTRNNIKTKSQSKKSSPMTRKKTSGRPKNDTSALKAKTTASKLTSKAKTIIKSLNKKDQGQDEEESTPLRSIEEVVVPKVEKRGRKAGKRKI